MMTGKFKIAFLATLLVQHLATAIQYEQFSSPTKSSLTSSSSSSVESSKDTLQESAASAVAPEEGSYFNPIYVHLSNANSSFSIPTSFHQDTPVTTPRKITDKTQPERKAGWNKRNTHKTYPVNPQPNQDKGNKKDPQQAKDRADKRNKQSEDQFNEQCPTQECVNRLDDCMQCLVGISLTRCRRFTSLTFGIKRKTGASQERLIRERRTLAKLLRNAEPNIDSAYCNGFVKMYANSTNFQIGTKATVNSVGLGVILKDELKAQFGDDVTIDSFVIYSPLDSNGNPIINDNEADDKVVYAGSSRMFDIVKFNNDMSFTTERRLHGGLRLPTTAKQVLHSNGSLRIWKIRQILNRLPYRRDWANVFSATPHKFRIRVWNGKTFLVFVNFAQNFREY